jgi:sulfite exporter TauE/SafE
MEPWTAFFLGLVGSLHCAGMCGPLALALPSGGNMGRFTAGRLAYNFGRMLTYCGLGLIFGLVGRTAVLAGIQRWLSVLIGVAVLGGLLLSNRFALWRPAAAFVGLLKSRMSCLLLRPSLRSSAVLGMLNGLLPCGLVYVACAGSVVSGSLLAGAQYMALFGAGTVPMMLAIGLSGKFFPVSLRLKLRSAIPLSIVLLGTLLIFRGLSLGIPFLSPDLSPTHCCCQMK